MSSKRSFVMALVVVLIGPLAAASALDTDGDGVDNVSDVCCGTPSGILVDEEGRPFGDVDADCDVDLRDHALLQAELTAPVGPPECCISNETGPVGPPDCCYSNATCTPLQYCQMAVGDCGGEGECVVRPSSCPDLPDPVCGCEGLTYSNACDAAAAGVSLAHLGPCIVCASNAECQANQTCLKSVGDCLGVGVCTLRPSSCPPIGDLVCGCNGFTYENLCLAQRYGIHVEYIGACGSPPCQTNADCDPRDYCDKALNDCDGQGSCEPKPGGCAGYGTPVCGCDGAEYADSCRAHFAGASVENEGSCAP